MDDERRQHPRVKAPKILVRVPTVEKLWTYLPDLSEGGLFVRAEKMLPLDTEVDIELIPPGADAALNLHGRVTRHQNDDAARDKGTVGMGIRFENLSPETQAQISTLLQDLPRNKPRADTDSERVRTQLQGVVMELGHVREELQNRERELQHARDQLRESEAQSNDLRAQQMVLAQRIVFLEKAAERAGPSATPSNDSVEANLRREAAELQIRLSEASAKVDAYQRELAQAEEDEAQSRALSERLAADKAKLEKQRKETAAEIDKLRAEVDAAAKTLAPALEEAKTKLTGERSRAAALEISLNHERQQRAATDARMQQLARQLEEANLRLTQSNGTGEQLKEVRLELDMVRARAAGFERQLQDVRVQLDRVKGKERDLRRLLAAVSKGEGGALEAEPQGEEVPVTAAPPSLAHSPTPPRETDVVMFDLDSEQPQDSAPAVAPLSPPVPASTAPPEESAPVPSMPFSTPPPEDTSMPASIDIPLQLTPGPPAASPRASLFAPLQPLPPSQPVALVHEVDPDGTQQFGIPAELAATVDMRPPSAPASSEPPSDDLDLSDLDTVTGPTGAQAEAIRNAALPLMQPVENDAYAGAKGRSHRAFDNMEDLPLPAGVRGKPAPSGAKIAEFDEFKRRLTAGDKLLRTDRFSLFTATEPAEVLVTTWLERADTMDQLCNLADGRLGPNRIARVVFDLYSRALVDFRR
ncbi:MAG: PilZ domain-containing protein [Myxococcaceae bacterium]